MKLLLIALNSRINHKAPALWCLKSYFEKHNTKDEFKILEHNINDKIDKVIADIFLEQADLIAFSCYIWNIEMVSKIAAEVKKLLPKAKIALGGPEVSFEVDFSFFPFADYILKGEGEQIFLDLVSSIKASKADEKKIIDAGVKIKDFSTYPTPFTKDYFESFTKEMPIENMLIYYESTRGCPFSCAYCLSSVSAGVSHLPLERVFDELKLLVSKGAKCIKFVDRTFNATLKRASAILEFIGTLNTDCTFHFEVAADLFSDEVLDLISKLPKKRVQFEIGIQSVNDQTLCAVSRKTDTKKALENIRKLIEPQNANIHVDLIAGLPYDSFDSFAKAFNMCFNVRPHMLQLGFLKMLKGSVLRKKSEEYDYIFQDFAPYEVFKSNAMSIEEILYLKDLEEVFDKYYNTSMFQNSIEYAVTKLFDSPFDCFCKLTDYCKDKHIKLSLKNSYTLLLDFLMLYTDKKTAMHYIKLDCFSFDSKIGLPDLIKDSENKSNISQKKFDKSQIKSIERNLKFQYKVKNVKTEYFQYDNKLRGFIYDERDPITKKYKILELDFK